MSDVIQFTGAEVDAVSRKLEEAENLDEHDREILAALFLLAGRAAAAEVEPEVVGFAAEQFKPGGQGLGGDKALNFSLNFSKGELVPAVRDGGLVGSFSWGMGTASKGHDISI